jgi:hypothetical protein
MMVNVGLVEHASALRLARLLGDCDNQPVAGVSGCGDGRRGRQPVGLLTDAKLANARGQQREHVEPAFDRMSLLDEGERVAKAQVAAREHQSLHLVAPVDRRWAVRTRLNSAGARRPDERDGDHAPGLPPHDSR